jgi:hypothetical protein
MAQDYGYDFQGAQGLSYKFQGLIRSNLPIPGDGGLIHRKSKGSLAKLTRPKGY